MFVDHLSEKKSANLWRHQVERKVTT